MRDISPPKALKPQKRYFEEVGEEMINGDGIIKIMQMVDTPEAKAVYKAFRKHFSDLKDKFPDVSEEKHKNAAIIQAIKDQGWNVTTKPLGQ